MFRFWGAFRALFLLVVVASCGLASAETEVRTIFAGQLHVVMPAKAEVGGASWSKGGGGLPSQWSAEANGDRAEVAREFGLRGEANIKARMAEIVPGVEQVMALKVSNTSAWQGFSSTAGILVIDAPISSWIVVARGPNARSILNSVCLERSEPTAWIQRGLPGGMSMMLPYELAPTRRGDGRYELKFEGMSLNLILSSPEEGKKFNIKTTVDNQRDAYTKNSLYKDVKVTRKRVSDFTEGELVEIKFEESGRKQVHIYMAGVLRGIGVQLSWTFLEDSDAHHDYSKRMLSSFNSKESGVIGYSTYAAGNSGFTFESPATPTASKPGPGVEEWTVDGFGILLTARTVETSNGSSDATQAAGFFFAGAKNAATSNQSFRSTITPHVVNGVFGKLARCTYELRGSKVHRWGLFLATRSRIYVLDVMSSEEKIVNHVISSAQLDLPVPAGLTKHTFKDTKISVVKVASTTVTSSGKEKSIDSSETLSTVEPGNLFFTSSIQRYEKGSWPDVKATGKALIDGIAQQAKGKAKILAEGRGAEQFGQAYWYAFELEVNGVKIESYLYATALGRDILLNLVGFFSTDDAARFGGQIVMNSYRPSLRP